MGETPGPFKTGYHEVFIKDNCKFINSIHKQEGKVSECSTLGGRDGDTKRGYYRYMLEMEMMKHLSSDKQKLKLEGVYQLMSRHSLFLLFTASDLKCVLQATKEQHKVAFHFRNMVCVISLFANDCCSTTSSQL